MATDALTVQLWGGGEGEGGQGTEVTRYVTAVVGQSVCKTDCPNTAFYVGAKTGPYFSIHLDFVKNIV